MKIVAIDTSCDETAAAVTDGRRVLANVIYSQVLLHKKWGGVVPSIAKRAHEEKIDFVIEKVLNDFCRSIKILSRTGSTTGSDDTDKDLVFNKIDAVAVTQGPGLAVALEVGIKKAKDLAKKYQKKLIAVNHLEGHIFSAFVQNGRGRPATMVTFPFLSLIISGGHTEIVVVKNYSEYQVIGETLDDAAGEALDKAAKLLGLGYPGGPVLESLAGEVKNKDFHNFPRPMLRSDDLNFSFSGLKTSFYYFLKKSGPITAEKNRLRQLASSFQEAVFDTIIKKTEKAIKQTGIKNLVAGGGVTANIRLRYLLRSLIKKHRGKILFPPYRYLTGDNAAMIGVAAGFKAKKAGFFNDIDRLDRIPRMGL